MNQNDRKSMVYPETIKISCKSCKKINKVKVEKLSFAPVCGSCKEKLGPFHFSPITVKTANFEKEVIKESGLVLVDFWAEWCPPCKMLSPILEKLSKEKAGGLKIVKINTDQEPYLAQKYQISSIPTLILFKDGRQIKRNSGVMSLQQILNWLNH